MSYKTQEELDDLQDWEVEELLTEQQITFARRYLIRKNQRIAAKEAGYSEHSAAGYKLYHNPHVKEYIKRIKIERIEQFKIEQEELIQRFTLLATYNLEDFINEEGELIAPNNLERDYAEAIKEIKQTVRTEDGKKVIINEYKFHDKLKSLEALGKHLGIFEKDNAQKTPNIEVVSYMPDNGREVKKT